MKAWMRYEQAFVWVATIVVVLMVRHDRLNDRGCLEGSSLAGATSHPRNDARMASRVAA